jgi:hypothetical protein
MRIGRKLMDQLLAFVQDRWLMILIVVIAIILIFKIMKSIVKWLFILALIAAIIIYGSNYSGEIKEIGSKIVDYSKEEAIKAFIGDSSDSSYVTTEDGGYTVTKGSFSLQGTKGSKDVILTYKGQSINLKLDDTLDAIVAAAEGVQKE